MQTRMLVRGLCRTAVGTTAAAALLAVPSGSSASGPTAYAASDRTAPKVIWVAPRSGRQAQSASAGRQCLVVVRDRGGVARVDYLVKGRRLVSDKKAPYTCEKLLRRLSPGTTEVVARATDRRGNKGSAKTTVRIPKTAATSNASSSAGSNSSRPGSTSSSSASSAGYGPQESSAPVLTGDAPATPATGIHASFNWMDQASTRSTMNMLRAQGITWAREAFTWSEVEARAGSYDWSQLDVTVGEAARSGVRLIANPSGAPDWATGGWNRMPASGAALDAYIAFIRKAMERYGTNGTFWAQRPDLPKAPVTIWDVWNEPWAPGQTADPDPAAYARMYKSVVSSLRPVDAQARFMLEADLGIVGPEPQRPFLEALFQAVPDLGRYIDIASLHAYTNKSPTVCERGKPVPEGFPSWTPIRYELCRLQDIRGVLNANGASAARLWITEIGWSTGGDRPFTEAQQAQYLRETYAKLREWRLVDVVTWFHLRTYERDPANEEEYFGLLHADGSPKPAWSALVDELRRA